MTTAVAAAADHIRASTPAQIAQIERLSEFLLGLPQADIETHHVLHGGMYARTIAIPAGVCIAGAFIRVPTILVANGHMTVVAGSLSTLIDGHRVFAGSAGRNQAFLAHADSYLTMCFATEAQTIADAEDEFTAQSHLLVSRRAGAVNHTTITGE